MVTSPQRAYRANCPNCGAPVEFASAASASAVCGFCRSTLVRDGDALRRIGVSAELFDDHTPLQLGAGGKRQGLAFTLVGRLQYGYTSDPQAAPASPAKGAADATGPAGPRLDGTWNEWHALFENGRSVWLSEDNGAYVLAFDAEAPAEAPAALDQLRAGEQLRLGGQTWSVASVVRARLIAAEGELPSPPNLQGEFTVVDLRNPLGEVGTLDDSDARQRHWSVGRSVALSELALSGLKDSSEKDLSARGIECPSCGAALEVTLASTKSISCHQCRAVIDLSGGVGADLAHHAQSAPRHPPQIPLGRSGTLAFGAPPQSWQVVGYLERCDLPAPGDDDEQSFWREYLLYHRTEGFVFLVDTDEGWSWVRPITGVPVLRGDRADWGGATYQKRWDYVAKVTHVQGEFYWRVQRDERAQVRDYEGTGKAYQKRMSREQVGNELTWSAGETIDADKVATAFGIGGPKLRGDVKPFTADHSLRKIAIIIVVLFGLMMLLAQCSGDSCDDLRSTFGAASNEYQQCVARSNSGGGGFRSGSGGSFGGWSSGGGHK